MKVCLCIGICLLCIQCPVLAFPQRIISTMPSITETLYALGLSDRIVGVTTNCNYPPEAKDKEKIGQMTVNLEKIVSLQPDLIIMLSDAQAHDIWRLKSRGLPVVTVNPHSVADVLDSILYIGSVTGTTYEARRLTANLNYRLSQVDWRKKEVASAVFVMVGYKPLVTCGKNTFVSDIVKRAGGENIVQSGSEYPQINFEELYRLNPDVLIIPKGLLSEEELRSDRKLSRIPAVMNGKILWIDPDILFRPGPRVIDAVEEISGLLNK